MCVVSVGRYSREAQSSAVTSALERAEANKRALCHACGFTCMLYGNESSLQIHGLHPAWDKVLALRNASRNRTRWRRLGP